MIAGVSVGPLKAACSYTCFAFFFFFNRSDFISVFSKQLTHPRVPRCLSPVFTGVWHSFLFIGFVPAKQLHVCFLATVSEGDSPSKLLVPKRTRDRFVPRSHILSC